MGLILTLDVAVAVVFGGFFSGGFVGGGSGGFYVFCFQW